MLPKKRGRPKSLLPRNIKENTEYKPSKADKMLNKDDQDPGDDSSLKRSKRNLKSKHGCQLEISSTTPVIRKSSRLSPVKPVNSPVTPPLCSSTQLKRNECKLDAIVKEDDIGECNKSFIKDSLTNSNDEDITPLINDSSIHKNVNKDICKNDTNSVATENFNHIFDQAIADDNCIDQEICAKICKESKSLQGYNILNNSEPSELRVNTDSDELNEIGKEKSSANKFNKLSLYKESISRNLEIEHMKNSSILTNPLKKMRKSKEENILFNQGSKNNELPLIDNDNQNRNFEVIEVSVDNLLKDNAIHTIEELEKKRHSEKNKESETEENILFTNHALFVECIPIINPLKDEKTLKCGLNEGEIEKLQESKEETLNHNVAILNNKQPFNNNTFGITEVDEGKMVEASNSTDIKTIPLNKTTKSPSHVGKSKQIPGISYILIIIIKDESGKKKELQYDCVLCNLSEGEKFVGAAMKVHLRSRSHLLNVLEIENNELYEKCKADTTLTDAVLYARVCICQSSYKKTVIANPADYVNKRKMLVKTVLRLRKALETSCDAVYPPSSLVNETDSLHSNIENTFKSDQEKTITKVSEPLIEDVQDFLKKLMLVIGHSWVRDVAAEVAQVRWLASWNVEYACKPGASINELIGMIPLYVNPSVSNVLLFTTIPEAYKRGPPGERVVYPDTTFTAENHAQQIDEFVYKCKQINPAIRVIVMIPPALDLWFYNCSRVANYKRILQQVYPEKVDSKRALYTSSMATHQEIRKLASNRIQWTDKLYIDMQRVAVTCGQLRPYVTQFLSGELHTLGTTGYLVDGIHPSPEFAVRLWEVVHTSGFLRRPLLVTRTFTSVARQERVVKNDHPAGQDWRRISRQLYREKRSVRRRAEARRREQSLKAQFGGGQRRLSRSPHSRIVAESYMRPQPDGVEVRPRGSTSRSETGIIPRHSTIRAPSPDSGRTITTTPRRVHQQRDEMDAADSSEVNTDQRDAGPSYSSGSGGWVPVGGVEFIPGAEISTGEENLKTPGDFTVIEEEVIQEGGEDDDVELSQDVDIPTLVGLPVQYLVASPQTVQDNEPGLDNQFIHLQMERVIGIIIGYSMGQGRLNTTPEEIYRYLAQYCTIMGNRTQAE